MANLLRSELYRIRNRPQSWWMIAILVVLQIGLYGGLVIASLVRDDPDSVNRNIQLGRLWEIGLIPTQIVAGILVTVFAASLMGNEYSWNTLRPLVARARSRTALLGAKWLTVVIYIVVLTAVGVLTAVISSILGSAIVGVDSGLSADRVIDIALTIARYGAGVLPYAALGFLMAVLTKSNAAGIALGIALQLIEPTVFGLLGILSDVFDTIAKGGLSWNVDRLVRFGGDNDFTARDATVSLGVIAIYVALFVAISFRVFNRRDVTSG